MIEATVMFVRELKEEKGVQMVVARRQRGKPMERGQR